MVMTHTDLLARLLEQMAPPTDDLGARARIEERVRRRRRTPDLRMLIAVHAANRTLSRRQAPSGIQPAPRGRGATTLLRATGTNRRSNAARALVLGFGCIVLAGAAFLAAYVAVDHFRSEPGLVFMDFKPTPRDAAAGWGVDNPSGFAVVEPVAGAAVLKEVKSQGTSDPASAEDSSRRVRGRVEVYFLSMSQPAISGSMEITSERVTRLEGGTEVQGSWVLRNSRGMWESSSWTGIVTPDGADEFYFGKADGTGAFEGLVLLLEWHVVKNPGSSGTAEVPTETVTVSGWIQSPR
jgi:hypothetical protein